MTCSGSTKTVAVVLFGLLAIASAAKHCRTPGGAFPKVAGKPCQVGCESCEVALDKDNFTTLVCCQKRDIFEIVPPKCETSGDGPRVDFPVECPVNTEEAINSSKETVCCETAHIKPDDLRVNICQDAGIMPKTEPTGCRPGTEPAVDKDNNPVCCGKSQLATTTAKPVVTTTKANTCKDLLNPVTGVSDCPKRSYLCNDSTYYDVMTVQCPKTCGRCSPSTPNKSACADKLNSRTGVSDCPKRKDLCQNSLYKTLMTDQCPKTCGLC